MIDKTLIERQVRTILHGIDKYGRLTTAELGDRITDGMPQAERAEVFSFLNRLGANARDLCELVPVVAPTGFHKGKTINRRVWRHIDSPDMPQRPATPSAGAASPGMSFGLMLTELQAAVGTLGDRVQALEDWRARYDPISTVL